MLPRTGHGPSTRCLDPISTQPRTPRGGAYTPLEGDQRTVEIDGVVLEQRQFETDTRARIKIGIGLDYVDIVSASSGHPKLNE